jgi:Spx/MgsR family transcriptional regulator
MATLYGIKNCDTVKKARVWLEKNAVDYHFHDYKVDHITPELLSRFAEKLGWEVLLNKRSSTWRKLSEAKKTDLNADTALQLLLNYPTLIKRPILETGETFIIGFNADEYQRIL